METSGNCEFVGIMDKIDIGKTAAVITIKKGQLRFFSTVSVNAVKRMELREGMVGVMMINPNDVMLSDAPLRIAAENQIRGTVSEIQRGDVCSNVILKVSDDVKLSSNVTNSAVDEMGLKPGSDCWAYIKASEVVMGI
ncbi:MAG: TOBE domain-containing protein [Clostridia bacterium]|nr:TOBE domain-containing protein [Clostridia bacterium]